MQDSDRDQRPHEIDDAKEFEDEASQVVDDDAYEIQNSEDWVELIMLFSHNMERLASWRPIIWKWMFSWSAKQLVILYTYIPYCLGGGHN